MSAGRQSTANSDEEMRLEIASKHHVRTGKFNERFLLFFIVSLHSRILISIDLVKDVANYSNVVLTGRMKFESLNDVPKSQ